MTINSVLLDEVLPDFDVSAEYSIRIHAMPERVYQVLQQGVPSGSITKLLMMLRNIPRWVSRSGPAPCAEDVFYRLKQAENREIVIGIVGQFWKPISNPLPIHSLQEFLDFQRDGFCKAALNLRIVEKGPYECLITTETRVLSYGKAREKFKEYWKVIGPFSGIIRKEILRKIKKRAEKK